MWGHVKTPKDLIRVLRWSTVGVSYNLISLLRLIESYLDFFRMDTRLLGQRKVGMRTFHAQKVPWSAPKSLLDLFPLLTVRAGHPSPVLGAIPGRLGLTLPIVGYPVLEPQVMPPFPLAALLLMNLLTILKSGWPYDLFFSGHILFSVFLLYVSRQH